MTYNKGDHVVCVKDIVTHYNGGVVSLEAKKGEKGTVIVAGEHWHTVEFERYTTLVSDEEISHIH